MMSHFEKQGYRWQVLQILFSDLANPILILGVGQRSWGGFKEDCWKWWEVKSIIRQKTIWKNKLFGYDKKLGGKTSHLDFSYRGKGLNLICKSGK